MNILPHKSWHVRTKKNIARVRKDEAKAAEEEKELQRKINLAAQEARTDFLRERAAQRTGHVADTAVEENPEYPKEEISVVGKSGHVNFFQEIEDGVIQKCKVNLEHEQEKKLEQEDYEKKIGYLTYLGQNSLEQTKEKPWYAKIDRHPSSQGVNSETVTEATIKEKDLSKLKDTKFKDFHDPLKDIRKYLQTPGVKSRTEHVVRKRTSSAIKEKQKEAHVASKMSKKSKKVKKNKKHKKSKHKHKKEKKLKPPTSSSYTDSDSDDEERQKQEKLAKLRADRLEREREERRKAEQLMAKLRGEEIIEETEKPDVVTETSMGHASGPRVKQKYNSQFNPHLARQNFDN